jgi:hypothetical protein
VRAAILKTFAMLERSSRCGAFELSMLMDPTGCSSMTWRRLASTKLQLGMRREKMHEIFAAYTVSYEIAAIVVHCVFEIQLSEP